MNSAISSASTMMSCRNAARFSRGESLRRRIVDLSSGLEDLPSPKRILTPGDDIHVDEVDVATEQGLELVDRVTIFAVAKRPGALVQQIDVAIGPKGLGQNRTESMQPDDAVTSAQLGYRRSALQNLTGIDLLPACLGRSTSDLPTPSGGQASRPLEAAHSLPRHLHGTSLTPFSKHDREVRDQGAGHARYRDSAWNAVRSAAI